ncbi:DegT/DnrJ/EryC1/StrS family aminotransferase [Flavobacterium chungangense]|uniref:dTDP-4-amino-4,6-dideoxy-D-glucose transaminase n=1 Tax=Flavobacterium chungangense TaxID=554283 RepID=A0A6V6ZDQ4_9FLAO|nr:DegT/DnrJ/EryC1/StrS family aminotransferase [Flavobacterium chungangense]CAD0009789.1 dTDP-4-amino-4,6-dideoxy-D-glucose transaminase [Flavobacterium chungangense]
MINVTKTFLPPKNEYDEILNDVWATQWLTNRGKLVLELETKLKSYLDVSSVLITSNGTVPLQIAVKILGENSEIITTPFSYVATSAAIIWENCTPVFVDIHPDYFTIDETKIEAAITSKTKAILATHVFGNPCDVETIEKIAQKHNLKVIYDAAHCFGVKYKQKSIFEYGDVSTVSFHATKLFHTAEGGALFCKDEKLFQKLYYSHNFGHKGELDFYGLGINGKISELQAAMGLAVFPYLDYILDERKKVVEYYNANLDKNKIKKIQLRENTTWNYSYYPVVFNNETDLLNVQTHLNKVSIYPRRYFYPSLNTINYINKAEMPISESISSRILCLPLYVGIKESELEQIVAVINKSLCL